MRLPLISCALATLALTIATYAAPPGTISFQGRLTTVEGFPVANGTWSVQFILYNDSTSISPANILWDSGPVDVSTTYGLFAVMLGTPPMVALPDSVFADSLAWLGIAVGGEPELVPRTRLAAVPYALRARVADSVAFDRYVDETGDTVNGTLAVTGDFSVGTDQLEAPVTLRSHNNWRWDVGSGYGDLRLSDGVNGLSLGVESIGTGAGTVRFWSSGGFVENLFFGSPTFGDIFEIHGTGLVILRVQTDWLDAATSGSRVRIQPQDSRVSVIGDDSQSKVDLIGSGTSGLATLQNSGGVSTLTLDGGDALGGQAMLYRDDGNYGVYLRGGGAAGSEGGSLDLWDGSGGALPAISLYGAKTGDASVVLPDDAINSIEIEDEPGLAASVRTTSVALTTSVDDILTVTITLPAHGYLVLRATGQFVTSGTTGINDVLVQIDETQGGSLIPAQYVTFGLGGYTSTGANYFPLSVERIYFKPVGSYTFRLEGQKSSGSGTATCQYARLSATYYPSSYGDVETVEPIASRAVDARLVSSSDGARQYPTETAYELDLTELERRADEAHRAAIKAEQVQRQAELELEAARKRQMQSDRN